jgi:hypothetical protein
MKTDEARWIYRWTTPEASTDVLETTGFGTLVKVY